MLIFEDIIYTYIKSGRDNVAYLNVLHYFYKSTLMFDFWKQVIVKRYSTYFNVI